MRWLSCLTVAVAFFLPAGAQAQSAKAEGPQAVKTRLIRIQAQLDAQAEARTRQADAFDAATSRIEFVNYALVAVLALAGIGAGLFSLRWVKDTAEKQITDQIEKSIRQTGSDIFEAQADALVAEYDEKFADLYRRYGRLAGDE